MEYLKNNVEFRNVPLMDGIYRKINTKALVGKCHNKLHKGYLTVELLRKHQCIEKNCVFIEKFEDYPFWKKYRNQQQQKLALKTAKKTKKQNEVRQQEQLREKMETLRIQAQKYADINGFPMIITRVAEINEQEYVINYVSAFRKNDWYEYLDVARLMSRYYGKKFTLKHLKLPDGEYAVIDEWLRFKQ